MALQARVPENDACAIPGKQPFDELEGEPLDLLRELELSRHGRQRRAARRARMCVYRRMRNLQNELHYKLCVWLTNNYSTIIMPTFNVHTVAQKEIFVESQNQESLLRAVPCTLQRAAEREMSRKGMRPVGTRRAVHIQDLWAMCAAE